MDNHSQMPIVYLEPQFSRWNKYLVTHQGANLFFLKNTGMLTRLLQFCDYYHKQQKAKLQVIDINYYGTTDPIKLELELKKITSHTLIIAGDIFTRPDSGRLAVALQNHYLTSPWSILIAHECSPSELYNSEKILSSCLYIHPNPFTLPTEQIFIRQYIQNILKLWKVQLSYEQITEAMEYCGNQPWLINECIRLWVENPEAPIEKIISHPNFTFRLKTLFNSLPHHYLKVLARQKSNPEITSELHSFGIIDKDSNPVGAWLKESLNNLKQTLLVTTPNQVIYDSVDITLQFSPGERRLINIFNQSTEIVTREKVAELFYDSLSGDYSDWALSQVITRLRHKLQRLNIPLIIKPKRGKGYESVRN